MPHSDELDPLNTPISPKGKFVRVILFYHSVDPAVLNGLELLRSFPPLVNHKKEQQKQRMYYNLQ